MTTKVIKFKQQDFLQAKELLESFAPVFDGVRKELNIFEGFKTFYKVFLPVMTFAYIVFMIIYFNKDWNGEVTSGLKEAFQYVSMSVFLLVVSINVLERFNPFKIWEERAFKKIAQIFTKEVQSRELSVSERFTLYKAFTYFGADYDSDLYSFDEVNTEKKWVDTMEKFAADHFTSVAWLYFIDKTPCLFNSDVESVDFLKA